MPILRIKVCDASGTAMPGQAVKVTEGDQLLTGVDGQVQFLTDASAMTDIEINGVQVWSGPAGDLKKEETFSQSASGFARAS